MKYAPISLREGQLLLVEIINVHLETARTVAKACLALKMISNNDANKRTLVLSGGLDAVLRAMAQHSTVVDVQSQCLATLSSLGLRQPDNCVAIVANHGVDLILSAMQRLPGSVQVQRSGCLALRNLVARNKEHVDIILGAGAEDVLRAARARHLDCNDVAFSALRDLGCRAEYRKTSDLAKGVGQAAQQADARKARPVRNKLHNELTIRTFRPWRFPLSLAKTAPPPLSARAHLQFPLPNVLN